ncbi:MAG: hypothetical protein KC588_11715 [Nitrospira sp.]|nr:hypothetical protein [Nitrospira sp.]
MNDYQILAALFLLGFFMAIGMVGCTWEDIKEKGYGAMRDHQIQRCLDDLSRRSSDCVNQQSCDSYECE